MFDLIRGTALFKMDPDNLIHIVLQAEVIAVLLVLHVLTALRVGTKVVAFAIVCVRREVRDLRSIFHELSGK